MNESIVTRRTVGVNFNNGKAEVRLWAPEAASVELELNERYLPLQKDEWGIWQLDTIEMHPGDRYRFRLNGESVLPDPASLSQPDGVHGPSRAYDLSSYQWTDEDWRNPALESYIIYELHTGTFSSNGDFEGIEQHLDHLVALGVNAIEIMPLAQFPGDRNWGYDGVYPYAVQHSYGGAEGLQRLVNACHRKSLAVIVDVVYNHFGPEGAYFNSFAPYTTDKYKTPWGGAINFDDAWSDGVRQYFRENVLMWFRDFHVDALRLDAVHAIRDFSPKHILQEIREAVDEWKRISSREHYLIVELDLNDNRYINATTAGGFGMDAQWVDEFHHALRIAAGGEKTGYYADFSGIEHLAKSYRDAYVYDGQYSAHRKKLFGVKCNNPGQQFIVFSQNHDQVGNRMLGERTSELHSFEMCKLMAAAVIASPYLPMLWMGEEWGEKARFAYFVSHTDEALAEAVRKGRREEFAAFHAQGEAPDPMSEETFLSSKLRWHTLTEEPHRTMLEYYRSLIALRRFHPALKALNRKCLHAESDEGKGLLVLHRWSEGGEVICLMNFSQRHQSYMPPSHIQNWKLLLDSAAPKWRGPQSAPELLSGGQPGSSAITLQPESVLIYGTTP